MNSPSILGLDTGMLIRRSLFFLLLLILTLANLFTLFRGPEFAAGDGPGADRPRDRPPRHFHHQVHAPGRLLAGREGEPRHRRRSNGFRDTYHAPLNPLILAAVFKLVGADDPKAWQMGENEMVFQLDRVVATVSTCFS